MANTMLGETTLSVQVCAACGVTFAMPEHLERTRRADGKYFYCPNGHDLWFGEGETERLRKQLKEAENRTASLVHSVDQERAAKASVERRLSATKGALTRTKNRIANGVCPCCNRSFVNLQRHMHGQHPEYQAEEAI